MDGLIPMRAARFFYDRWPFGLARRSFSWWRNKLNRSGVWLSSLYFLSFQPNHWC
jgi:hypothetical protein